MAPTTYNEYRKIYDKYKTLYGNSTAVLYQVGSFFELYDVVNKETGESWCNVKEIVDILGIQLSIKPADNNTELFFAGFPDYALHRWAAKLTQIGWTVVVVEQKKDAKGNVEVREVSRVLSPGTHQEVANGSEAAWIAAIWLESTSQEQTPSYGLAAIDLTTGQTALFEGQTRGKHTVWSADEAIHFFQVMNPRELLFLQRSNEQEISQAAIRRIFGISASQPIHIRHALPTEQGSLEIPTVRLELLKRHFSPKTLLPVREYLNIHSELTERALCCLLRFIEDHFTVSNALSIPTVWASTTNLSCGNNALAQLNFVGADSVLAIFNRCTTPMGKRAIRNKLLMPFVQRSSIEARLKRVDAFMTSPVKQQQQHLSLMFDLPRLHRKIMNYAIGAGDVLALHQTYTQAKALIESLGDNVKLFDAPSVAQLQAVLTTWSTLFSLEKAEAATENQSFFVAGMDERIDAVEAKIAQIYTEVDQWIKGIQQLDLKLEEKQGQPISVRGTKAIISAIHASPPKGQQYVGLECKITKSVGHTLEAPFLESANGRILGLRSQLARYVQDILPDVCIRFYNETGQLWALIEEFIEEVDCVLCFAQVAKERDLFRPEILDGTRSTLLAKQLRHPLIEALPSRSKYVAHDVDLTSNNIGWLLYGMNASGKSSLMKAIGIAVLLAQCGSYVPASSFQLVPFEKLMTRILNVDNLWAGLSSFAVEVSELRDIFTRADEKTLVLGDELCAGTESVSATALVAAGIQYLLKRETRFVFATHYHDLLKIPTIAEANGLKVWHLKVRYDPAADLLIYDRTLSPGSGSTLYGIEVAKALGMPHEILEESVRFRRALQGEVVEEELSASSWSPHIVARACEICGSRIAKELEVHHIQARSTAPVQMNSVRNLIVVCAKCHDAHHAGVAEIAAAETTSVGDYHSVATATTPKKEKYSSEQLEIIQKILQEHKSLPLKMVRGKLQQSYSIDISIQKLRSMREHD